MSDRDILDELPILQFLPDETRAVVARRFVPVTFPFGAVIVSEGEATDALYVIVSGRARVIKRGASGEEVPLNVLRSGDSFGEAALFDGSPQPASVRASTDVIALRLDGAEFGAIVEANPYARTYLELHLKHATLQRFFRKVPSFNQLPGEAVAAVAMAELQPAVFNAGDTVYRQGDAAGPVFLIDQGRLRVMTHDGDRPSYVATLGEGESFGLVAALRGSPQASTVEAVTPVRLLTLSGETLTHLAAGLPGVRAMLDDRVAQLEYQRLASVPPDIGVENVPASAREDAVGEAQADDVPADASDAAPFAEGEHFIKRGRRRRVPFIQQVDEMDCGAASLAMIARAFGRRIGLARIRQLVNTGLDGTSLRAICRAAEELGLAARSVKASLAHLDAMPLPAIVHWNEYHWIVLEQVGPDHVRVVDPAFGKRRLPRAEFERTWTGYAALFEYTADFEQAEERPRLLSWMWPLIAPYRRLLLQAVGLAILVSALHMLLPAFTQVTVDRVLVEQDLTLLHVLIATIGVTMLFIVASLVLQRYLLSYAAVRIDASALDFLTGRLLALPMSYFASRRTGDLQRRIEGMRQARDLLLQNGVAGITAVAELVATVALMAVYSPWLMFVFLLTAPLYAALMIAAWKVLRPVFVDLEEQYSKYHAYQIDAIKGIETVKALGGESAFRRLLLTQFKGLSGRVFRADFTVLAYDGAIQAVSFLGVGLFLWAGSYEVLAGRLSIGGLVAFNALVALSTAPLRNLMVLWDDLQRCGVLFDRLDDVFQHEPEQGADRSRLRPVPSLTGHVALRDVGFRYGGPESPAIVEHITLAVPAGTTVAIVGRSGSGKTTLVKCLAGLLEPTAGTILYDGLDMTSLDYRDLRRHIGFVLQDTFVFADTIARNIAFGQDEPDMARVAWAAEVANAHEFIGRLPFGYDTKIGESGLAISGGQRQRIAIARAIYHRPPVLVLDEATAALDTESERAVQQNIDAVLKGRTAFIIAHRLSTVQNADLIVVLDRGRLVEHGTHEELMKRRGLFYYLASQQLGAAG